MNPVKSVLLYAATGSGKTVIASKIIADAVRRNKKVWFLVHRAKLVDQTVKTLKESFGIDVGVIAAKRRPHPERSVQICMVQTLAKRDLSQYGDCDVLITDEAHNTSYFQIFRKVINHFTKDSGGIWALSKLKILGLTATPWRTDKKQGFCQFFQALVRAPRIEELVASGNLRPPRVFGFDAIAKNQLEVGSDGEYTSESIRIVCTEELNDVVIRRWLADAGDRKTIAFFGNKFAMNDAVRKLRCLGVLAEGITAETKQVDRSRIFKDFDENRIRILCSIDVLTEGFDQPDIACVVLARPTKSVSRYIQMVGRGIRKCDRLTDCLVLDFGACSDICLPLEVDNPDVGAEDQRKIQLCPRWRPPKNKKDAATVTCPRCQHEHLAILRVCPDCGYENPHFQTPTLILGTGWGEILSKTDREKVGYLRTQLRQFYSRLYNPNRVTYNYMKRYGQMAPDNWFFGLVFGGVNVGRNQIEYRRYLECVIPDGKNPKTKEREIARWMAREFSLDTNKSLLLPPSRNNVSGVFGVLGVKEDDSIIHISEAYTIAIDKINVDRDKGLIDEDMFLVWIDAIDYAYTKIRDSRQGHSKKASFMA